jgi:CRISPR-associated protein Cmr4
MTATFNAYFIQCITNLHVGSGDAAAGIIDKMVQRDPITNYPTINASSLKGGLREHFENKWGKGDEKVNKIFGKETGDTETGTHKFLNADLIALPIRCTHKQYALSFDKKLADLANAKSINIAGGNKKIFSLSVEEHANNIYGTTAKAYAEDFALQPKELINPFACTPNLLNEQFATFENSNFENLAKNLPVIARNKVGENLWYEEIVPHQTIFITFIGTAYASTEFVEALKTDLIQVGANASVGYGLCKFIPITF